MRRLVVTKLEGNFLLCEDEQRKLFAVEAVETPIIKEGDVIMISDEGEIRVDSEATQRQKSRQKNARNK